MTNNPIFKWQGSKHLLTLLWAYVGSMRLRKEVEQGYIVPDWYGIAYWAPDRAVLICYPIPLNMAVATYRWVRLWCFWLYCRALYQNTTRLSEIVICAAIRMHDGYVVRGHRHSDAMRTASEIPAYKDHRPYSGDQGFVTSRGRYVGRVEACKLQKAAGIKSVLAGVDAYLHGELYSEDLY